MENRLFKKSEGLDESITDKDHVAFLIDIWKKTVDVQMHFNQLSLQVRNFLITLFSSILAAFFLFVKDGKSADLIGFIFTAFLVLVAMFIMDYLWYHRFLISAVRHAGKIENELKALMPNIDLGETIRQQSAVSLDIYGWPGKFIKWLTGYSAIGSRGRLRIYYLLLLLSLLFPILSTNMIFKPQKEKLKADLTLNLKLPESADVLILEKMNQINAKIDSLMVEQNKFKKAMKIPR